MNLHAKQIKALKLAILVLEKERRQFSAGHVAYVHQGVRFDVLHDENITYTGFEWAEKDHKKWVEYDDAIQELEDLIEILQDPGVIREQPKLFEYEQTNIQKE